MKKNWLISAALSAMLALGLGVATLAQAQTSVGEVTDVDVAAAKIKLKHNGIENLDIPAMKMSFKVADPAWLKTVQVGDKVKFSAEKVGSQFTVTALTVEK
jgi:Cu(I)/Ag(I) efflux system periplasmic protein CusF